MKNTTLTQSNLFKNNGLKLLLASLVVPLFLMEAAFAGCLSASPVSLQQRASSHAGSIAVAVRKYQVDKELIQAVIAVESCFNTKAVSPAGAEGLMQLMPATADRFGVSDSFNARQNILAGTRYLKWLLKRFNGNIKYALAGYNAGEGRVDQYNGIPPFKETKRYVKNVIAIYSKLAPQKVLLKTKTIANGSVYYPYGPLTKSNAPSIVPYTVPVQPKALTAKPGRQGLAYMKSQAPHLYRKP